MNTIVVTRHKDLISLLRKMNLIKADTPVFEHVDNADFVAGKNIIGVIPAKLGILANTVTEIPLNIPDEFIGQDIPIDALEKMVVGEPETFKLLKIPTRIEFKDAIVCNVANTFIQYIVRKNIIPRRGAQHMDAVQRNGRATKELILNKPVLGNIRHCIGQFASDITTFNLQYKFERRGLVHTFDEMDEVNKGLFTYKVERIK